MTVFRVWVDGLSLLIARPKALWRVRSHPGIQTGNFRPLSTATRIENHEDVGLGFFDRVHQLLGGESLIGICGGQRCDARYRARVKLTHLDVTACVCSTLIRAAAVLTKACRSRPRADDNGFARLSEILKKVK